jgi:hypothetical protein
MADRGTTSITLLHHEEIASVVFSFSAPRSNIVSEAVHLPLKTHKEFPMVHDVVLALVFLAMIVAPALISMSSTGEEIDSI